MTFDYTQRRSQRAFFHDGPVGSLHAITDTFLVYIESDIVVDVHWVLLFEVSEPVVNTRSRHCSLQENPSSFRSLYIQTCGIRRNNRCTRRYGSSPMWSFTALRSCCLQPRYLSVVSTETWPKRN